MKRAREKLRVVMAGHECLLHVNYVLTLENPQASELPIITSTRGIGPGSLNELAEAQSEVKFVSTNPRRSYDGRWVCSNCTSTSTGTRINEYWHHRRRTCASIIGHLKPIRIPSWQLVKLHRDLLEALRL